MKRIFTFVAIMLFMSFCKSFAGTYSGGDGIVGNPYQISSTADLIELSNTSADWSSHFILTQDIAFDADETQVDWDGDSVLEHPGDDEFGFSPIGNIGTEFTGTFDGQGFEIDNLFINRPSQDYIGLFGNVFGASAIIENLGVTNVLVTDGYFSVGGLVGSNSEGTVNNCYSTGSVTGYYYVGGLVGSEIEGTVNNCYSTGSVTGDNQIGGLVGINFASSTVSNCYSTGSVTGDSQIGGLVGYNSYGTVNNCYSTGSVTGNYLIGGLVGDKNEGIVNNCFSTGNVEGYLHVGGLVGFKNGGTINNCYSTGSAIGENYVGGLIAYIAGGTVNNCYSTGSVTADTFIGGLVGYNSGSTFNNSFWDTQTSGQATSDGGTGKTTAEMKDIATYTDYTDGSDGLEEPVWDFKDNPNDDLANDDIWNIQSAFNNGYPYFVWQFTCHDEIWVSELYDNSVIGWNETHFDDLTVALNPACEGGTVNISNYTHTGNVDMTGKTFIIGDDDFILDGNLTGGFIQTPSTGRLILPAVQNVQQDYPMGDGNNNYTLKIIPMNAPTNPVLVRLVEQSVPGAIQDPMLFWDIQGDDGLDATLIFRIDKSAIAPKTLNTNSILRFFDGDKYIPMTEEQVTINDIGTYYEIIIINVNQF